MSECNGVDVNRLVSGYYRPIKIKWKSGLTQGELQKEIMRRLMGDDIYRHFGYKTYDVQERVADLLNMEVKYRQLQKLLSANS